jgi:hypothetical protein
MHVLHQRPLLRPPRDLDDLVTKDILERIGLKQGAHYVLAKKK